MKMKMKNTSHRYDINRHRPRHGHKKMYWVTFEAQFMKKLSNTEVGWKKSVGCKESVYNRNTRIRRQHMMRTRWAH